MIKTNEHYEHATANTNESNESTNEYNNIDDLVYFNLWCYIMSMCSFIEYCNNELKE